MRFGRSAAFALCSMQTNLVAGSVTSFVRGGLDLRGLPIDGVGLEVPREDDRKNQANKTMSRVLQDSELMFADTFLSQVNRTYAFPQSLDTDCAVGPTVAIGVSYHHIEAIFTATGEPVFANSLRWLFNSLLPHPDLLPDDVEMMSPRVAYDGVDSNFIVATTMTDKETFSKIYLAVSFGDAPESGSTMDWGLLSIDVFDEVEMQAVWAKEISVAVDQDQVYITATMYATTAEQEDEEAIDSFVESRVWVINKIQLSNELLAVAAISMAVDGTLETNSQLVTSVIQLPSFGPYQPVANDGIAYLVAHNDQSTDAREVSVVTLTVDGPDVASTSQIVSLGDAGDDLMSPIPEASQPNEDYSDIRTGDRRVTDAVLFGGALSIATTIKDVNSADRSAVFWATIDVTDSTYVVASSGVVTGEGILSANVPAEPSTFHPSLALGPSGELVVGYAASGENLFSGMYASKAATAELDAVEIKVGEDSYENLDGFSYHGEYSGMSPDPTSEGCFWAFNTIARFNEPLEAALIIQTWARGALAIQWGKVCLV